MYDCKDILKTDVICCLIITFNPDDNLLKLVNILLGQINKVIIVDNHSDNFEMSLFSELVCEDKVFIINNEENFGIAKALNQGIDYAESNRYKWVLTFDQDSKPYSNIIDTLAKVYNSYPDKLKIGAIGVNAVKKDSDIYFKVSNHRDYLEKDYLITAGCLLSIEAFNKVGRFREDFFIDNVDLEYSLRLKKMDWFH